MYNFIDYLSGLWNTPSINASEMDIYVPTEADAQAELETQLAERKEAQDKAFQEAELLKAMNDLNSTAYLTVVADSSSLSASLAAKGAAVSKSGGLLSIRKLTGKNAEKKSAVIFDEVDYMDYNNRYISMDAMRSNSDPSDIAFFRIINNQTREAVFPNTDGYPQPGITQNKFKQFIVTQIQEPDSERMQLIETSDEFQLLFYGKKVKVLSIGGILKNTKDNPWNANMIFAWSEYMRGTKLAEEGNIMMLYIDGQVYYGYPFNFNRSKMAGSDHVVSFNMSFVVKEEIGQLDTNISIPQTISDSYKGYL